MCLIPSNPTEGYDGTQETKMTIILLWEHNHTNADDHHS